MSQIESNIFPIRNLSSLSSTYRLYRIRGLRRGQAEYHQNRQLITRKLSFQMRNPVTVIDIGDEAFLVVRSDAGDPPSPFPIIRGVVYFDRQDGEHSLDYTLRNAQNDEICLRFVQFTLQAPLSGNARLWQPAAGQPFFEKTPSAELDGGVARFSGFAVRAVLTPDGGIGLCIDVRHKFLGTRPLGTHIQRDQFRPWRGRHLIYHYGHRWFEIQARELEDLNVTDYLVNTDDGYISLVDYIVNDTAKPIPEELARLPHDAAVLHYANNQGADRAAPAALCYPVFDTHSREVQRHHRQTIMPPHLRRAEILRYKGQYLTRLKFGSTSLQLSESALKVDRKFFAVPDFEFGNRRILSVRGTPGAEQTTLDSLGQTRAAMLRDRNSGFFVTDPLEKQYYFLPQSIADSCGPQYMQDLAREVDTLFPQERAYAPTIVTYDDRNPLTYVEQGKAVLKAAQLNGVRDGYGVVMIHEVGRRQREHDQLAAMVIRELRKQCDLHVAVNHSVVCQESYVLDRKRDGTPFYRVKHEKRGKLSGYLRNVALNKILLTSERWPFVLATPLHADLTIGIDVKLNTAGFTVLSKKGTQVRTKCWESTQKERLMPEHVKKRLREVIEFEARAQSDPIRHIVLHRDGRLYQTELEGAERAIDELQKENVISHDATLSILEISKSAPAPLRLFVVSQSADGRAWVDNPMVGFHHIAGSHAYLCATGRPFDRAGTVQPLHVHAVKTALPIEHLVEDLYFLTTLAWTRPEDCTRYPITLKLTDRRLGEEAEVYDQDALEFAEQESEEANT